MPVRFHLRPASSPSLTYPSASFFSDGDIPPPRLSSTELRGRLLDALERGDESELEVLIREHVSATEFDDPVRGLLIQGLLKSAEEEGVLWTPLLDMLARYGSWSYYGTLRSAMTSAEEKALPTSLQQAERLRPWLSHEATEEEIKALLTAGFSSFEFQDTVLRYARNLSAQILDRAEGRGLLLTDARLEALSQNHHATKCREDLLGQWCDELLHVKTAGLATLLRDQMLLAISKGWQLSLESFQKLRHDALHPGPGPSSYVALEVFLSLPQIEPKDLTRIADEIEAGRLSIRALLRHSRAGRGVWKKLLERSEMPEYLFLLSERLKGATPLPSGLASWIARVTSEERILEALLSGPHATLPIARTIALSPHRSVALETHLATRIEWRGEPEIRQILLASREPAALLALLSDAREEEMERLLRHLLPRKPQETLEVLEGWSDERLSLLSPELLAPCLSEANPQLRLRAIRLTGRMGGMAAATPRSQAPSAPAQAGGRPRQSRGA